MASSAQQKIQRPRALLAILAVLLTVVAANSFARPRGPLAADLSQNRNKNRLLFIFAPSADESRYAEQAGRLRGTEDGLKERDMIRFDVFETGASKRGDMGLTAHDAGVLRQRFQMAKGQFKVLLLDKDGRTAFTAKRPASINELFAAIDATPLRRYEVRTRKKTDSRTGKAEKPTVQDALPNKLLTPEQVVKIQMEALQHNNVPKPDSGIAKTFDFASPQNRQATGPLDHFTLIVKSPAYLPMLNCKKVTYDPILVEGEKAQQRVHIIAADGSRITYIFLVSRQTEGAFAGCWMNDGCVRDDSEAENHRFDA